MSFYIGPLEFEVIIRRSGGVEFSKFEFDGSVLPKLAKGLGVLYPSERYSFYVIVDMLFFENLAGETRALSACFEVWVYWVTSWSRRPSSSRRLIYLCGK